MALSRLGDFIELVEERNSDNIYKKDNVRGISTRKMFIPTKANLEGVSLSGYKLVPPLCFAYVSDTSRRGDKISLAFNDSSEEVFLVSSISTIFRVRQSADLNPYYLFMYFNRTEFDRYTRYNSWGSARETFSWDDMCDIEIDLPSLEEQQKVVDVYLSLVANQKAYEKGLDDLKLTCDAYIEELRRRTPQVKIGPYIYESNTKNENSIIKEAVGVGMKGIFTSKRTANKDSIESCKLVDKDDIVWATQTTCGIGLGAVDIYARDKVSMIAPTCNI
jgi:type I restriction enzyme S subunit